MDEGRTGNPQEQAKRRGRLARALAVVVLFSLLATTFLAAEPVSGLPDPQPSYGVDIGPSDARTPSLAVDAAGFWHLVRSDNVTAERGIYYTDSADGATWRPSARLDTAGASAYYPRIAVEREPVAIRGRIYVTYQVGTGSAANVWFTASDGGTVWAPPRIVQDLPVNAQRSFPSIAASNGRVCVEWSDLSLGPTYFQVFVRCSADGGATWGTTYQLSAGVTINIQGRIAAKGNTIVAVWRSGDASSVAIDSARSDDGGATWTSSPIVSGPATDNLVSPDVFVDELGIARAVWSHRQGAMTHIEYAWSADGSAWSTPVQVDDTTGIAAPGAPSIGVLAGILWVAWHDRRNGNWDVFASWSSDGVTWGDGVRDGQDLRVDDSNRNANPADDATNQGNATLSTGGGGVAVAWEDARNGGPTGPFDVYAGSVATSPILITEVQDEPSSQARVELYNIGSGPYPLSGVSLVAGATNVDLSPLGSLGGRSYVVIGAGGNLVAPLDLGTEGAHIEVRLGAEVLASVGTGLYGTAPDPLSGESTARFAGTLDYTNEWTRSQVPSFGSRNAVPPPDLSPSLVLNEVLFNPTLPNGRFVELYYRGATALDLTGYRLVGDGAYAFPGGTIGPASRYANLVESQTPSWFQTLDASGDNVYLYDPSGRLLDMVGWTSPHTAGTSVARVVEGAGGSRAYDDASAPPNGWAFDRTPTLALVTLAADQRVMADVGTTVPFPLTATNRETVPDTINLEVTEVLPNWPVAFEWPSGAPLTDSPADPDSLPDLGVVAPGASVAFVAQVTVPLEGALGDGNVVTAIASAGSVPAARASVNLTVNLYPHFDVVRTVDPPAVYAEGTGPPYNEVSQVTLAVNGAGFPVVTLQPQDVVWQIDVSGSMATSDPANLRVDAVNYYIDNMRADDRGSVIGFNDIAWVVNNRPLTYTDPGGKIILNADANTTRTAGGGTNIDAALQLGNNWLITYGFTNRPRIEILLTDGQCTIPVTGPCPNTAAILDQSVAAGIVIYTIGLGGGVDTAFLTNIATRTGGQYYHADTAQDLLPIYQAIGERVNRTAGVDPNPTDNVPMIQDDVQLYINFDPASFIDPLTGQPRPPSNVQYLPDRVRLQWNVDRIQINETWAVRYDIRSPRIGLQDVAWYPDSRVTYMRWDNSTVSQPIPRGRLMVYRLATPPYITNTVPADAATNVSLDQSIEVTFSQDMDWPSVQWTISPSVALTPSTVGRVLILDHATPFAECTRYVVNVTRALDTDAESLVPGPVPNPWSFSTICPNRVRFTITRSPAVNNVTVDDVNYSVPVTFTWVTGDVHHVVTPAMDPLGSSRLVFLNWDDGGARDRIVTVPATDTRIVADYAKQHHVGIRFVGLVPAHPAGIRYALGSAPQSASSADTWSDYADDGSNLNTDATVLGATGERFVSLDPTSWPVTGPLSETVTYYHQYNATLHLNGLDAQTTPLSYVSFGQQGATMANGRWSAWVDAGRQLRVDDLLMIGGQNRERYRTLDPTRWIVDAPLEETVTYLHQFRPRVTLLGLDANHTVGAAWTFDRTAQGRGGLANGTYEWADAGTALVFDAVSSGTPPLYAQKSPAFTVDRAFDETLLYAATPPPPPVNWKPVFAVVYTIALVAFGTAGSRRILDRTVPGEGEERKERKFRWAKLPLGQKLRELTIAQVEDKVHRDRRFTRALLLVPFPAAEAAIGALSYATGVLRIPEAGSWFPAGFWVNTALLAAGVVLSLAVWRRGYRMTDDAVLRLAAAREREAGGAEGAGATPPPPGA